MSTTPTSSTGGNAPSSDPRQRRREQRGWYTYDWANQVFITSVVTVLIGPYLSGLACDAAGASGAGACLEPELRIHPLGVDWISVHPNALHPTLTTGVVLLLVLLLPLVRGLADQSRHTKRWLFWLATGGSVGISSLYLTDDDRLTALLFVLGNDGYGLSLVVLHALLPPTLTTGVVLLLVLLLPLVGALADQSRHKKRWLFWLATGGSVSISSMYLTDDYRLTALLFVLGNVGYGLSIVVFHAFLPEIATEEERNRVSVTGWSLAYLGGALLLTLHLGLITWAPDIGLGDAEAVRIAF